VRIPQVCLHFGWFVVIAQCNLCDRRGKVNVVPTTTTIWKWDATKAKKQKEVRKTYRVQVQTHWRQTRKTVYLSKCISRQ